MGSEGIERDTKASNEGNEPRSVRKTSDKTWLRRTHAWFESHYGLDLRSLAVFRIGLGYLLLSDLVTRSIDLRAHYTDAGILTRERLVGGWGQKLFYSLHIFGGDVASQVALFLVAGVFAFMLFVGYRTRLAAVMSWVMLCSVQGRNYIILQGGDDILRVMLFWSIFVPLGARFSVDAVLAERQFLSGTAAATRLTATTRRNLPRHVLSIATTVLVMQLFTMYFVSAALKTGPTWHRDGSAISLALHHHAFASRIGQWFRLLPVGVLQGMTWQVWWLELCGPLLFFIPWGTFWWRTLQAFAFISFHFGLFLTMELGHFPWVAMVCWLTVLPSWFWDKPLSWATRRTHLRPKLRSASIKAQAFVLKYKRWLGRPYRLPRVRPTFAASMLVLVLATYTTYGSAYAMTHSGNVQGEAFNPLLMTRLYANWGMFAPNPPSTSGWFVTVAKQRNGNEIDVWNDGQPVTFEMPSLPSATYKRQRWRKFGDNILSANHAAIRGYFLRYLCLDWNEDHEDGERIDSIVLYHMAQTANWPGKGYGPLSKNELARETCPALPGEEPKKADKPAAPAQKQSAQHQRPKRPKKDAKRLEPGPSRSTPSSPSVNGPGRATAGPPSPRPRRFEAPSGPPREPQRPGAGTPKPAPAPQATTHPVTREPSP